jgi:DNA-binding NarL/FixJ family response regulator
VNVLVADADSRVRSALRLLLEQMPEVCTVGEAWDCPSMICSARCLQPRIVLLDWHLAEEDPAGLLCTFHLCNPGVKIIALGTLLQTQQAALDAGVEAFVNKGDAANRLISILNDQVLPDLSASTNDQQLIGAPST